MRRMVQGIATFVTLVAIIAALLSAFCWYMSARVTYPVMLSYWGGTPPTEPYQMALQAAGFWNFWAATFAVATAVAQALVCWLSRLLQR